eukprot:CAMPEP_0119301364 /NCGR_PEP_ID=MMETSP1333-20130426/3160_1 /TAXON_ID=418940 /ORGANISM="Scyphosphaera apsteinii, Strain RCC1455" /LENGTH=189 /DNA_ID=CAMNT_0007303421 /DNA_START=156 /DNA_END=725 /DNA_ORIENTATION=-
MLPDDVTLENVGGTDTTQAFFGQEGGPGRAVVLGGTAELIECVDPGDFDTQKSLQKPTKYKATATKKSTKAERFHKKHSPIATQCCLDSECHREYTNAGDHPDNLGVIVPLDGLGTVLSPGGPFGCYSGTDAGRITAHTYNEAKEICKNQGMVLCNGFQYGSSSWPPKNCGCKYNKKPVWTDFPCYPLV